jgi:hypothetical protein
MVQKLSQPSYIKQSLMAIGLTGLMIVAACNGGGGNGGEDESSQGPTPETSVDDSPPDPQASGSGRTWTVAEILAEPASGGAGGVPACGGEFGFKRCICANDVPSFVKYRPAVAECGGSAAAILSGRLLKAFSIVVRDSQNRDRWPAAGSNFGGCSAPLADSASPPNRCSAFKVQSKFKIGDGSAMVHCFGASGYSDIFADAARLTVKLSDDPLSNNDEIERYCLRGGTKSLN